MDFKREYLVVWEELGTDVAVILWCCYFTLADACDTTLPPHSPRRQAADKDIAMLYNCNEKLLRDLFDDAQISRARRYARGLSESHQRALAYGPTGCSFLPLFNAIRPIHETLWGPVDAAGRRKWTGQVRTVGGDTVHVMTYKKVP